MNLANLKLKPLTNSVERTAKFNIGDEVIISASGLSGHVIKVEKSMYSWLGFMYDVVQSNGTRAAFREDELQKSFDTGDVFALCENRNFSNYDDYMIVNTLFKIDNVNCNTISTLRASRTQFKAYQFKPLLKFFASPEKRILIADEVGLGKTIEAGHILLELKARKEFRNAIIVCPKSLREKWQTEMEQRFGLDFTIYGGEDNEGNKYPTIADLFDAYKKGKDVHAIVNYERIRYKKPKKDDEERERKPGLIDFLLKNEINQSIVICDESHRLRNETTLSYSGAEQLLAKTNAAIFLTATPVMIKEDNLYNQMHLLCPEKYSDALIFANRMSQGKPFVWALNELGAGFALPQIWQRLSKHRIMRIMQTETKSGVFTDYRDMTVEERFAGDPIYERVKRLFHESDNPRTRAALQLNLGKMSAIQNEFTRTTKRQIRNELSKVNNRYPVKVTVTLNEEEQQEFNRVINEYDRQENATGSASFGLIQIKRMVSSSVYGYCNAHDDLELGIDEYADKEDAKVNALIREVLSPSKTNNNREIKKVIVFAVFIDTLKYLKIRLTKLGVKCAIIDGSVADRQEVIDKFKVDDTRVLLSSEVGSEGLDMQFCDTIVNYDLPWNPMVVEQRIGRIDRIGQKAENIYIYNFVIKGSIAEDIYSRLDERIGIFTGTIGDLEPILSAPYKDGQTILEAHNNIETKYYNGEITKEQVLKEEEEVRLAIEAQKITIDAINDEMSKNTISVDSYYDDQIKRIQQHKAYVTDAELRNLLVKVLKVRESGCSQCVLEPSFEDLRIWKLRLPQNLDDRDCLVKFLNDNRPQASDSLRAYDEFVKQIRGKTELTITFDQNVANENHRIIFVNNYSPLIQACNMFRAQSKIAVKKAFKLELQAEADKSGVLKAGDKFFMLNYQLTIQGASRNDTGSVKELCPVLFDVHREEIVTDERIIASVCCLAQDSGRETPSPSLAECSREVVAKFKALATQAIGNIVAEKKKDIDEQNNVERARWIKEFTELYDSKIKYYQGELNSCEKMLKELLAYRIYSDDFDKLDEEFEREEGKKLKNEIAGYTGTVTRLKREKSERLEQLGKETNVAISREEVSVCYITIK